MKKVFRRIRGMIKDSLETTTDVSGLDELRQIYAREYPFARNVRISRTEIHDRRLPEPWSGREHYILADFDGRSGQCIGMCNFYED